MRIVNFFYNVRPNEQQDLKEMHEKQQELTERASVNNPKHFIIADACTMENKKN